MARFAPYAADFGYGRFAPYAVVWRAYRFAIRRAGALWRHARIRAPLTSCERAVVRTLSNIPLCNLKRFCTVRAVMIDRLARSDTSHGFDQIKRIGNGVIVK